MMPLPKLMINLRNSTHRDSLSSSPTKSTGSASETIIGEPSPIASSKQKIKADEAFVEGLKDPEHVPGWPELTQLITKHPDLEAFPPYRDLHIKSLLYYQAELDSLRDRLRDAELSDYQDQGKEFAKNVDELLACKHDTNTGDRYQLNLVIEVRRVLKEYSEALLLYKQVTALPQADKINVNSLRVWLARTHENNTIEGHGTDSWGDVTKSQNQPKSLLRLFLDLLLSMLPTAVLGLLLRIFRIFWRNETSKNGDAIEEPTLDLIVPRELQRVDGLTHWVASEGVPFWESVRQRWKKKTQKPPPQSLPTTEKQPHPNPNPSLEIMKPGSEIQPTLTQYTQHSILQFTSVVATIVACLLPTAAIAVLSNIHTTGKILGLIAGFTTVFALGLMMLTDAGTSRVQIFTATAAFSAVLVVFVQNQSQSQNNPSGHSANG